MTVNLNSLFFFNLSIADGYAEQFKYIDTLIRAFSHFIVQCACNASFGNELGHFLTLLYNVYATPLLEMSWVFRAFSHFTGQCVCSASSGNELGSQESSN
ncbi:uncharacterized protein LOC131057353 isoform X4 [Cryptomeria japonica]|uniref:uncharacterized protein LOC131057353 isoform X4 n=1 Tax=Cryptomeria japonica TaxID=3369 RepID=UPI0027D9E85A|nr:uncharacterized protein LOC131057353 isoform X4 [Cryptomeria japonica]